MPESELPTYSETYDPSKIIADLKKVEANPVLLAKLQKTLKNRALDMFQSVQLSEVVKPGNIMLYVGAGSGHFAQLIEQKTGAKVFKTDLYDLRVSDTKDNHFVIGNGRQLPFLDESCDVVTTIDVLHHCQNQEEILEEAKRVLKSRGKLILLEDTLPEEDHPVQRKIMKTLISFEDNLFNRQSHGINPCNYRSIDEWKNICVGLGFNSEINVRSWYWGPLDFVPESIKSTRTNKPTVGRPFESSLLVVTKL